MLMLAFLIFVKTSYCFPSKEEKRQIEEFKKKKKEGKISNTEITEIEYDIYVNLPLANLFRFVFFVGLWLLFVSFVLSFTQGIEFTKELFFFMVKTGKSFILSFLNIEN